MLVHALPTDACSWKRRRSSSRLHGPVSSAGLRLDWYRSRHCGGGWGGVGGKGVVEGGARSQVVPPEVVHASARALRPRALATSPARTLHLLRVPLRKERRDGFPCLQGLTRRLHEPLELLVLLQVRRKKEGASWVEKVRAARIWCGHSKPHATLYARRLSIFASTSRQAT